MQNPCASKSDSHGFASKSDTHHRKKHLREQVLFSVIFALRASIFRQRRNSCLRSDIRLTPSGIRFASFGGEYNITGAVRLQYHCRLRQYHADEVGISLKTSPTELKLWTDSNRHTVGDDLPGVPRNTAPTGRRGSEAATR